MMEKKVTFTPIAKPSQGSILQVFLCTDMRCAHEGLRMIAKSGGVDVDKLQPNHYVVFINNAKDRLKLYASNQTVAYHYRKGERLDLRAIAEIPKVFGGSGRLNYDRALKSVLEKALAKSKTKSADLNS